MSADDLVARLEKVRRTGQGRWLACCPAHPDKSPSLSIRELEDGRVLLRCFAECSTENVLAAVDMTFNDLFPERLPGHGYKSERVPFPASDVLRAVRNETLVVAAAAATMARGKMLSAADGARLMLAAERLMRGAR